MDRDLLRMLSWSSSDVRMQILGENDLNMNNDVDYLFGLLGEVLDDVQHFENDTERAKWAVARWCLELGYEPDLRDYRIGESIPKSDVPNDRRTEILRESREETKSN